MMVSANIGILLAFIGGYFLSYSLVPSVFIVIPIVFCFMIVFFPETPVYFMRTNREQVKLHSIIMIFVNNTNIQTAKKAIQSLEFYRNIRSSEDRQLVDFAGEMEQLKTVDINGDNEIRVPLSWHDFSEFFHVVI